MKARSFGSLLGFMRIAMLAVGMAFAVSSSNGALAQTVSSSTINGITVKIIGGGNQQLGAHKGGARAVLNGHEVVARAGEVIVNGKATKVGKFKEVSLEAVDKWGLEVTLDGKPFQKVSRIDGLKIAAKNGDPVAQNNLGVRYLTGDGVPKDVNEAVRLYTAAAEQGAVQSQSNLANMFWSGRSVERDAAKSVFWARKAAEQGSKSVFFILARAHETGEGVEKDLRKAVEWYTRSAEAEQPTGISNLATFYLLGEVVDQDVAKAIELYKKASALGNATASNNLGIIYRNGKYIAKDLSLSKRFFAKAVEQKHPLAGASLKEVEAELAAGGGSAGTGSAAAQPPQLASAGNGPPPLPGAGSQDGPPPLPGATTPGGPPPLPKAEFYYAGANGQQMGPLDETGLAEKIGSGEVTGETLVWRKGMAKWTPVADVPELAPLLAQAQPTPPPLQQYHVVVQGQQQGPFGPDQLRAMAQNGQISADSMVWTEGMSSWQPLKSLPDLAAILPAAQTPPPLPGGGGQTPAVTPPQPQPGAGKQFKVRSFCSATGKEGFGTGATPQIAMQNAVRECVANGGLPNCCPNDIRLVQ